jgi:hypothetical protein
MAQTIALNIVLNGVPQAVNTIEELEIKLKEAKLQLSQIAIGSDAFKKLAVEIQAAESQLKTLQKSSEGKDLEGKLGDFARLGGAIGASFGAATAAFSLFGEESEDTTKALAQAQNALVIALAAREAAEGAVVVKTIANDIATKALAASTAATNSVTKAFFATLAANPYGAIIAAVGLLVGALVALTGETNEATKAQKEFQKNIDTDVSKEVTNLKVLTNTINDTTQSLDTRKASLENLKKSFPGYFKNLKDEDILTGKVKIATDKLTGAIVAQAQARALENRIAERSVGLLDLERELARATAARAKAERDLKDAQSVIVTGGGTAGGFGGTSTFQANAENNLFKAKEKVANIQKEINRLNRENKRDFDDINKRQKDYVDLVTDDTEKTDKNTDAKEKNIQATREQIRLYNDLEKALNAQIGSIEKSVEVFRKLAEAEAFDIGEPEIITTIKALKSAIDGLIPDTLQDRFKEIGLEIQLIDGQFKVIKNTLEGAKDTFGEFTETIRKSLSAGVLTQGVEEFGRTTMDILNEASLMFQKGLITKEAFESTEKLIKQYKDLNFIIKALPEGVQEVFTGDKLKDYLEVTKQIAIATGDIKFERDVNGQIVEITNSAVVLSDELAKLDKFTKETTASLVKLYTEQFITQEGFSEKAYTNQIDKLVKTKQITEEQGENLKDKFVEFQGDATKLIQELAKEQAKALDKTVQNIVAEENQIRAFLFQVQQQRGAALQVQEDAQARVFVNNLELVYDFTQKEQKIIVDATKTTQEQREKILKDFAMKNIDLTKLTEEEIDAIIQFYLNKQKEALDEATKNRLKRVTEFQALIQEFQAVLNALNQTSSVYFDAQFDQLEKRYKRIQETIIGDSEEANQKRLEAEKSYQAERAKLEKQQAKTALKISLAQAAANTAEAITKAVAAYGGTPAAFVAAAAIAALSATQTAIIANQLAQIDSYRKGGMLNKKMAGGGMLFGPSHEQGGIKFAQGGFELEGNESVINRVSTINYMGLLSQINQAGGGRPIGPGYDDSRIIEAIAKQRNTPIRAYVVESDITAKQETARRLEKLSQI